MLVGRDDVLATARAVAAAAHDGRGAVLLLSGEPGIGKTRIAQELARTAADDGFVTLWASCFDGDGTPAFWPWAQLLRAYAGVAEPDRLRAQAGPLGAELARIVPGFAGFEQAPPRHESSAEDRFRLFDAVAAFLGRAAADQTLVLVVDDVHYADRSSIDLLRFAASRLGGERVLVVGTKRSNEPAPGPIADALFELSGAAHTIDLRGLGSSDVAALFEDVTGTAPDDRLVATIHARSGGNPLFVRELARLLAAQGALADPAAGPPAVPSTVEPVIARRVGLLGAGCRSLLEAAAVIGTEFDLTVAGQAAAVRDPTVAVADAVRAGVLVPPERPAATHRFVHGLVRDVVYASIDPDRRADLHRGIGAALERRASVNRGELLVHFARAGGAADLERALSHAEAAAADAFAGLAFEEAATLAQQGFDIADRIDADDGRRTGLLLVGGDARNRLGDVAGARTLFLAAAEQARRCGDVAVLARAALGYGYIPQLESLGGMASDPTLRALLEEALAASPTESVEGVLLRWRLAMELSYVDVESFRRLVTEALAMARRLGDPVALGRAIELHHQTLIGVGSLDHRRAAVDQLLGVGRSEGLADIEMRGHVWRVVDLLEAGDIDGVDRAIAAAERHIEHAHLRADRWYPAVWRAMRALLDGRLDDAERLAADAVSVGEAQGQGAIDHLGMQLMAIRREQGRLGELVALIQDGADRYPEIPAYRGALAMAYAESGQRAAAQAELDRLAADRFAAIPRDYNFSVSLMVLSITCTLLGDTAHAATLMDLWKGLEDRFAFVGYGAVCGGAVAHHLGTLAATAGRDDEAIAYLETALARHRDTRATVWGVRTEIALGRLLASRDPARSHELLDRARTTATELGLVAAAAELDAVPSPASTTGGVDDGEAVFRRDGELWELTFARRTVHVRDAKGVRDLARLLASPGREVHALDLVAEGEAIPRPRVADEVIDARAAQEYRARFEELREELDDAEAMGDVVRAERAKVEMDALADALASAYGLGGRRRTTAHPAERARKAVTERIRASIRRITELHPELGTHLARAVNTGTFVSYTPDRPIHWTT